MKRNLKLSLFLSVLSLVTTAQEYEWVIKPQYDNVKPFTSNNLAPVFLNGNWGYINKSGTLVVQPQFINAEPYKMGLAAAQKNDNWGFVDDKGNWIIAPQYKDVNGFAEGLSGVCKDNWGFIDKTGHYAFEARFEDVGRFSEGFAAVRQKGKWGFVDKTGAWVIKPQFKDVSFFTDGLVGACQFDSWGFIDKTGKWVIEAKYQDVETFAEGLAAVKLDGKWGYADRKGSIVLRPIYANVTAFTNGLAAVCQKGKWGYIDKTGVWIIQPQFDDASDFADKVRIAAVKQNGKWGYIERPSISSYIKKEVEEKINEWQKKSEFEKTTDYQNRVNGQPRNDKIQQFTEKAIKRLKEEFARKIEWSELKLSEYDADNETYLIKSAKLGDFAVPVSLEDAPMFKQNWANMNFANADFTVNEEQFNLAKLTISDRIGGKTYQYDSKQTTAYVANNITYNFAPIELDIPQNEVTHKNTNNQIENRKIEVGVADVDVNIPSNTTVNTKTFAIIIGNENYQRAAKVAYAANDAKIFSEYCQKTLGLPTDNIRMYKDASYGIMLAALKDVQSIATAYHGDIHVIFYYAGHGVPAEDTKEAYLLPVDADGTQPEACYPLSLLYKKLQELNAKSTLVFMDACFSGAQRGEGMLASARGVVLKPKLGMPQGNMVVFSAATDQETAYPYKEKGHGLFTYFLLKKLQETKGDVTLGDLNNYLIANVSQQSIVVNRKSQTPTVTPSLSVGDGWKEMMLKK